MAVVDLVVESTVYIEIWTCESPQWYYGILVCLFKIKALNPFLFVAVDSLSATTHLGVQSSFHFFSTDYSLQINHSQCCYECHHVTCAVLSSDRIGVGVFFQYRLLVANKPIICVGCACVWGAGCCAHSSRRSDRRFGDRIGAPVGR